ncbi:MAG: Pyrroline-5-carboxylate reductase [Chroococcopsis gigantea SAG 12.99]|nr:Pyrroline-5-carboxylate reductase [Chroococcopsis gigantea SAG 12.99]
MFKLGVIGGGVMAEAIVSRLLEKKIYQPQEIIISDPVATRRDFWSRTYGLEVTESNQGVAQDSVAVLLAIKPQILETVIQQIGRLDHNPPVLSILAGVTLERLETLFPGHPIIRIMPNTPATVGAGMTAIAGGKNASREHLELTLQLFSAVGQVVEIPESLMDGVTGLSGSGPAFVALMVEALADGGVGAGLPRPIAQQLALQTVLGTAQLLQESGLHPAQLKDRVTSPGGTTIAGVGQLEKQGFRSAIIEAVLAAYRRSQELGKP